MFTLTGSPVTFSGLLILFGWCLIWTVRDLLASMGLIGASRPAQHAWAITVSQCCHVVMSLVMLAMVPRSWWMPFSSAITEPVLIGVFAAGTLWMAAMAVWRMSWLAVGHTLMFGAMAWHLSAMAGMSASMGSEHSSMGGMGSTGGHDMSGQMGGQMSGLTLVTGIGLPLMVALVILGISGLVRTATAKAPHPGVASCCHVAPTSRATARLSGLTDAAMGFGMAWMSAGLMSPLLPFMAHLHP
ncbi:DUF5134 domain-containing protein [Acidipropionibacterium virtanenii]|uniref:DUF5134 domain-containing protein n=1 Tax=Acidipropionibacterium virtanenii TaxID=2057246 RepID=A0A344URL9_9ACTN|nr:DUF5134 domain-containing protein [Acidipropionibacterium virtanenii]AXE37917.1 hypothetical protein JS278_00726 [Acidipropionibacterium virtanenii]